MGVRYITPPLPADGYPAANWVVVSTPAEAAAMQSGKRLVKLWNMPWRGTVRNQVVQQVWQSNLAGSLYRQNPTLYPTVAALNQAAEIQNAKNQKADASGGFLNFVGNYVAPAVMAIVLVEVGGAMYTGLTVGGSAAAVAPTVTSSAVSLGAPTVDTSLPGLSAQELATTQAANIAASSTPTLLGSALTTAETTASTVVGAKVVSTISNAISPAAKPAAPQAVAAPVQHAISPWWIGVGLLAAKLLLFT